jgi:hypothetical protein
MMRWAWLVVGIPLIAYTPAAHGGEKGQAPSEQDIKALIDQLVSPNPKPITGDDNKKFVPYYEQPPGFDRKKQEHVHDAREKLTQLGPQAFPFLIERWDDKRYCMTTENSLSGYPHNRTVGYVCRAIIFDQLQPYGFYPASDEDPRGKPGRPSYPTTFLDSEKTARRWWEKHMGATLYQMQREALEWVIAEEAKRPRDFTDKERRALQSRRKELAERGKPLPPGDFMCEYIRNGPW